MVQHVWLQFHSLGRTDDSTRRVASPDPVELARTKAATFGGGDLTSVLVKVPMISEVIIKLND